MLRAAYEAIPANIEGSEVGSSQGEIEDQESGFEPISLRPEAKANINLSRSGGQVWLPDTAKTRQEFLAGHPDRHPNLSPAPDGDQPGRSVAQGLFFTQQHLFNSCKRRQPLSYPNSTPHDPPAPSTAPRNRTEAAAPGGAAKSRRHRGDGIARGSKARGGRSGVRKA